MLKTLDSIYHPISHRLNLLLPTWQLIAEDIRKRETEGVLMASDEENFSHSVPTHLINAVYRHDPYCQYQRTVAASLVQGVYILERDRQQRREGPQALAPPWWTVFNFQLEEVLTDTRDMSLMGAVYKLQHPIHPAPKIPEYVIAFRGTLIEPDTRSEDIKLDLMCLCNTLHQSDRFQVAMHTVQRVVASAGAANVWLAGHSLGSAIALAAGKNMYKMGHVLDTYLFNPPFLSFPIESLIRNKWLKRKLRFIKSLFTVGVSTLGEQDQDDYLATLSHWKPYLFVNPADHICSEYISYFENRERKGAVRNATNNSIRCMVSGALGGSSEAWHLLPSANLTTNQGPPLDHFRRAHGIAQWWNPHLPTQSTLYHYDDLH